MCGDPAKFCWYLNDDLILPNNIHIWFCLLLNNKLFTIGKIKYDTEHWSNERCCLRSRSIVCCAAHAGILVDSLAVWHERIQRIERVVIFDHRDFHFCSPFFKASNLVSDLTPKSTLNAKCFIRDTITTQWTTTTRPTPNCTNRIVFFYKEILQNSLSQFYRSIWINSQQAVAFFSLLLAGNLAQQLPRTSEF